MATPRRKQSPSVEQQLFDKPYEFEYPQAIRLLEMLYPAKEPVAGAPNAHLEAVRIQSNILLSTPPSDLFALTPPKNDNHPATLTINFMGIAGQTGPLPAVYSEVILDRLKNKDFAFRSFLDLFNNRLNGIHYRIQVKYNLCLNAQPPHQTEAAKVLKYLGGLSHPERLADKKSTALKVPLRSYIKYAGLLWQAPHSSIGLKVALEDYFHLPIEIKEFQGEWAHLEKNQWTYIGKNGHHNVLGESAALGTKAWIHGSKIRLQIGPLSLKHYHSLLPNNPHNHLIAKFTRHYMGRENFFDYELSLKHSEATQTRLDGKSALGWTTWMPKIQKGYLPTSITIKANDPLDHGF